MNAAPIADPTLREILDELRPMKERMERGFAGQGTTNSFWPFCAGNFPARPFNLLISFPFPLLPGERIFYSWHRGCNFYLSRVLPGSVVLLR